MEISNGCIVAATAGRDSGQLFLAVSVEKGYAAIIDGKGRRVEKPKRKNIKHMRLVCTFDEVLLKNSRFGERFKTLQVTNSDVRRLISEIKSNESERSGNDGRLNESV